MKTDRLHKVLPLQSDYHPTGDRKENEEKQPSEKAGEEIKKEAEALRKERERETPLDGQCVLTRWSSMLIIFLFIIAGLLIAAYILILLTQS